MQRRPPGRDVAVTRVDGDEPIALDRWADAYVEQVLAVIAPSAPQPSTPTAA
jgi:hypothetical protein